MIQRIQSIFLLIAAIIPIVIIFIPIGVVDTRLVHYVYDSISLKEGIPGGTSVIRLYYLAFCLALTAGMSLFALFRYKNRVKQMQIVSITMIIFLITLLLMLWVCPDIVFKKFFVPWRGAIVAARETQDFASLQGGCPLKPKAYHE